MRAMIPDINVFGLSDRIMISSSQDFVPTRRSTSVVSDDPMYHQVRVNVSLRAWRGNC